MARDTLGGFEMDVIRVIMRKAGKAYGVSIAEGVETDTGRLPSPGAIYTTLERLEKKGLVTSNWGEPTAERGGRRKRLYQLTADGAKAAQRTESSFALPVGIPA